MRFLHMIECQCVCRRRFRNNVCNVCVFACELSISRSVFDKMLGMCSHKIVCRAWNARTYIYIFVQEGSHKLCRASLARLFCKCAAPAVPLILACSPATVADWTLHIELLW